MGLGIAAHHGLIVDRAFGSNGVGGLVDLSCERLGAGQAKDVVDAVLLTPGRRLGAGVMAVAAEGDVRFGPAPANVPDQAAQMRTNLNAARRLAGAQDNRNRPAALGVVDGDRQKAVLVIWALKSESCWRPCTTSTVSSMSSVTVLENLRLTSVKLPKSCSPRGSLSAVKAENFDTCTSASALTQSGSSSTPDVIMTLPPPNARRKASLSCRMRCALAAAPSESGGVIRAPSDEPARTNAEAMVLPPHSSQNPGS
jgi:hypothetical protein